MKFTELIEADRREREQEDDHVEFEWSNTAKISAEAYPGLVKKFEAINKRAQKLGVPEITLKIVEEFDEVIRDPETDRPDEYGRTQKMYKVEVEGETPKLANWDFLATIEHAEGGNVIRAVPDADENDIKQFYEARPHYCDWCKKARNRIDTFIVRNHEDGDLKQVGRNCLKDFLGGKDPKAILNWFVWRNNLASYIDEAEEEERSRGGRPKMEAPVELSLQVAAAAIRNYGYIKTSGPNGYDGSTSHMVRTVLFYQATKDTQELHKALRPTDEDKELAAKALEWFKSLPDDEKETPFLHNIDVIVKGSRVSSKNIGFLAALLPMYDRHLRGEQEKNTPRANQHLGQVGDKIGPIAVKVVRTRVLTGQFGQTQICTMEDAAGNTFVWFNNSSTDLKEGDSISIIGTVKKHDDFNGRNQTHLTRVKVVPADFTPPQKGAKKAAKTAVLPQKTAEKPPNSGEKQPEMPQQAQQPQTANQPQPSGTKSAMAVSWFKEVMAKTGKPPGRGEFIQAMTQPPFSMTPAGASTYHAKIKKALVEGMSFTDYLLLVG